MAFHWSGERALKMFRGEGAAGNRPGGGPGRAAGRRQAKRGELGPESWALSRGGLIWARLCRHCAGFACKCCGLESEE